MYILCADFEGVFVPEVWINLAQKTGIEELKVTTREISDYNVLMKKRLAILEKHNLKLKDITDVVATIKPLDGAKEFLDWARATTQIVIVSDTFEEFAQPLLRQLNWPTILCHSLTVDSNDRIIDYNLRQQDPKRKVIKAFKSINYKVIAFGDSYNDTTMLNEADKGILYCPPQNVIDDFPHLPVTRNYDELKTLLKKYMKI